MAEKVKGIRVLARRENFRRAGRVFGSQPTDIPVADLKRGELERLRADPSLLVVDVEIAAPAEAARAK
jgi:hypothetical protein